MKSFVVIVPAYNEESSIKKSIEGILSAANTCSESYSLKKIIICLNGCTDHTDSIVEEVSQKYPNLIEKITSPKGYIKALNSLLQICEEKYPEFFVIKIDADSIPQPDSFKILLDGLDQNPQLIVAGGHPIPSRLERSLKRRLIQQILYARAYFPQSEISKSDPREYHPLAPKGSWEERAKIHFHGRFWGLRPGGFSKIPDSQIGDDVYICAYLLTTKGKGCIRVYYEARCEFEPTSSLLHHWKTYKRIDEDIRRLKNDPQLEWYIQASKKKLDWKYIFSLPKKEIIKFMLYAVIVRAEEISFRLIPYREAFWSYASKENL